MAWGDQAKCKKCGRLLRFVQTQNGKWMPCDSFSVKILPSRDGRLFYLGDREAMYGFKVDASTAGAVAAWEPHFATCPKIDRVNAGRINKPSPAIEKAREASAAERKRMEQQLLAKRQKEWAEAQYSIFS